MICVPFTNKTKCPKCTSIRVELNWHPERTQPTPFAHDVRPECLVVKCLRCEFVWHMRCADYQE